MQVTPANNTPASAAQAATGTSVRVLSGNVAVVPTGTLLQATVTQVSLGQAVILVNGQALTVRTTGTLQPGPILLLRAPAAGASTSTTLDVVRPVPAQTTSASSQPTLSPPTSGTPAAPAGVASPPVAAPPPTVPSATGPPALPAPNEQSLVRVDVLAVLPDGRARVQIDGQVEVATTTEQLVAGGRYILEVARTSAGLALGSPPETPELPANVAAVILRGSPPPDLGAALKPLLAELETIQTTFANTPNALPLEQAVAATREAINSFLPQSGSPLNATQLQTLVEDGGLHFEAKLARLVNETDADPSSGKGFASNGQNGADPDRTERGPDLKESLLTLLQAARDLGSSLSLPSARTALDGIESQQAANVFAQNQGTPYLLQIPFPDQGEWRTLNLSVEPDGSNPKGSNGDSGFRLLMHVPLTELGETWIDAGLSGNNFRAVLYLQSSSMRERVRAELPGLRAELMGDGFSEVLLDVRASSDLPARQKKQAEAMKIGRTDTGSVLNVRV